MSAHLTVRRYGVGPARVLLHVVQNLAVDGGAELPAERLAEVVRMEVGGELTATQAKQVLAELVADPPQWLVDLRRNGPHPKNLVAAKLGVSISGLARGGVEQALTTEQIDALLAEKPDWLAAERESYQEVLREQRRLKAVRADQARER